MEMYSDLYILLYRIQCCRATVKTIPTKLFLFFQSTVHADELLASALLPLGTD